MHQCWHSTSFMKRVQYLDQRNTLYYLWPEAPSLDDPIYCALHSFNICNGAEVYKKNCDCIETYTFANLRQRDSEAKNIYFFEKDILEHFILYFKSKLFPLIMPPSDQVLIPYRLDILQGTSRWKKRDVFIADTEVQHFYLRAPGEDIRLTRRQEECLSLFALGKKMKEIGSILNLSEKTIEFYLRKIMKKAQLDTKSKLLCFYLENRKVSI